MPSTMIQSHQNETSNNSAREPENSSDTRIAMTVDQVVSSLRNTTTSAAVSTEQPLHFIIHQMPMSINTLQNASSQIGTEFIQMPTNTNADDDDIQVVEDEAEIEELEEEAAPFCKNCANEVPLIIKLVYIIAI